MNSLVPDLLVHCSCLAMMYLLFGWGGRVGGWKVGWAGSEAGGRLVEQVTKDD